MKNITLAVDADVLAKVRKRAAEKGTTVNAMVREHLARIAHEDEFAAQEDARRGLRELMRASTARLGPDYKWNREELYDREALRRYQHPDLRGDRQTRKSG